MANFHLCYFTNYRDDQIVPIPHERPDQALYAYEILRRLNWSVG